MARAKRCPSCGGTRLEPAGDRRARCQDCGSRLVYQMRWVPFILTLMVLGAVVTVVMDRVLGLSYYPHTLTVWVVLAVLFRRRWLRAFQKLSLAGSRAHE